MLGACLGCVGILVGTCQVGKPWVEFWWAGVLVGILSGGKTLGGNSGGQGFWWADVGWKTLGGLSSWNPLHLGTNNTSLPHSK